ncbi:MAG: zinc metallopeptidase [Thermoleophilia bacterium]|nr:zinc metallopeptidase [Thermoleophilia bacterium]
MFPLFWDWTIILLIPALLFGLFAQYRVSSTFNRFSKVRSGRGLTGAQGARMLLDSAGLGFVSVESAPGRLSDHYDPRSKVLRLSRDVAESDSLAALGVAAHEAGHAIQDAEGYAPMKLRSTLVPVANIGSNFGFILFFVGLIMGRVPLLMNLGIVLFSAAVLFTIVTLPVEINASRRALRQLSARGILVSTEVDGARKVLSAAALTYVAAALMAILNLVRLILISRER